MTPLQQHREQNHRARGIGLALLCVGTTANATQPQPSVSIVH
jgi:hypothetical protein